MAGDGKKKEGIGRKEKTIRRYTPKRKVQKGNLKGKIKTKANR